MEAAHGHEPIMVKEVLELLAPDEGDVCVDCTAGRGGHAIEIAKRLGATGSLIAMDVDPTNLAYAKNRAAQSGITATCRWFHANFAELEDALDAAEIDQVDGVLADLGVSTNQLIEGEHGLSFSGDNKLDMRLDPRISKTAADLLAELDERAIADLLFQNAQERMSFRIARKIVLTRASEPIRTTGQLARLVRSVVPGKPGQIDPATRTFQALRMAVNQETESLEALLDVLPDLVKPGGRVAILSFHSGEDRLVKHAMREWAKEGWCEILTKKPLEPDEAELYRNPRSRSAKLRAVRFLKEGETEKQNDEELKDHEDDE